MTSTVEACEIAIVGGGSAGLATAALLRSEGLSPLVLEQGPESLEASAEPVGTTSRVIRAGGRRRRQGP